MPFPIRQNDADPDPQHDNKLRENKIKSKGIRIDEGNRTTGLEFLNNLWGLGTE
jgi:hypothetical protein